MFWLNEVIGRQPNRAESELTKPSQAREPEISLSEASRFSTVEVMAAVSPMVSVADTRNIIVTEMIALRLNSSSKGMKRGRLTIPAEVTRERSTLPMNSARM